MKIDINDIRKAGYCVSGARRWFAANQMDFNAFLKAGGMDADEFVSRGDHLAQDVVDKKIARESADG